MTDRAGVMPAEWAPHERCLMAWPTRRELWGRRRTRRGATTSAPDVELAELAIDDSRLRDSGPIFCVEPGGGRFGAARSPGTARAR
jgi:agmatine deiminase